MGLRYLYLYLIMEVVEERYQKIVYLSPFSTNLHSLNYYNRWLSLNFSSCRIECFFT